MMVIWTDSCHVVDVLISENTEGLTDSYPYVSYENKYVSGCSWTYIECQYAAYQGQEF